MPFLLRGFSHFQCQVSPPQGHYKSPLAPFLQGRRRCFLGKTTSEMIAIDYVRLCCDKSLIAPSVKDKTIGRAHESRKASWNNFRNNTNLARPHQKSEPYWWTVKAAYHDPYWYFLLWMLRSRRYRTFTQEAALVSISYFNPNHHVFLNK